MGKKFAIILAAGKGTRMKSKLYKVLHPVAGKSMVEHVVDNISQAGFDEKITVVGHGADQVKERLGDRSLYCLQEEQLGTAHAVMQAESLLADKEGLTLVVAGDTPLIRAETFEALVDYHEAEGAKATILTAHADNPYGYGRIIRRADGSVDCSVEEKDATEEERQVQEINTGTYVFDNQWLFKMLHEVNNDNAQGEYYLPDVLELLKDRGQHIAAYQISDMSEALGVNDRLALAEANRLFFKRQNEHFMRQGVSFVDPSTVYIEAGVSIASDTLIEANVQLKGQTSIGHDCVIGSQTCIRDSQIGDGVKIRSSEIEEAEVGSNSDIGPHAHLRPKAKLASHVHIGNYVEVKNATIGQGTKVGHLTYIGDADLGADINVSCGVIFCNYDGVNKARSVVGDHSFIGSNVNIVAPVQVAANTFLAAGSTITDDVPEKSLAIARARQSNKENYWDKLAIGKKNH
ncbi:MULTISPECIES: bifunctional UDP-N-acetylglucosamine diphosphorylase/glucosamine-1-phosphate N-acetyltransferase GlmU [unclassified Aerococcus]|uniref:bifunctional UDP-N-acetylglucosamine diphosphorylase/glucosamine-1-phosphate N-acetyltransferase GlmU n=1 Tax=unclassified Aerococcus TaxID=2618060 RepID=UPI0008A28EF1|nr:MULTISPECIES: bifunctional UDP-N-acetylglucosamine diphosphorylase/glucosamine-1-phosphate N-acetyltransferase GlmU [unclassified Aerococcus]KAB0646402.1 bifunctional UDP-N-acetylglucosamine diphosphorylase/glucosamine-1-phosphate N-acetyltransferase GlmU [Aerococcus sanguinicola]MDK6855918.1 bifunctional UDP-N-acetylglucosamine diphosphorylase/glucosamine-1-phosphate N-acetyltransferase GlmU [Aerococcus sp. UMB7533]OFN03743.1 bifunctional N-acetylglucosamine-1-phosphate uridyltransferase/glu